MCKRRKESFIDVEIISEMTSNNLHVIWNLQWKTYFLSENQKPIRFIMKLINKTWCWLAESHKSCSGFVWINYRMLQCCMQPQSYTSRTQYNYCTNYSQYPDIRPVEAANVANESLPNVTFWGKLALTCQLSSAQQSVFVKTFLLS